MADKYTQKIKGDGAAPSRSSQSPQARRGSAQKHYSKGSVQTTRPKPVEWEKADTRPPEARVSY